MEVSFLGYFTVTSTITAEVGKSLEYNFQLFQEQNKLEEVVVTGPDLC